MKENDNSLVIVVDDREKKANIIRFFSGFKDINVRIRRMRLGDYQINARVLLERKTIRDFAVSIIDGRLFGQIDKMARSSYDCILVLEGHSRDAANINVSREAFQGAIITISLVFGVPVLRSADTKETAKLIVYAGRQLARANIGSYQRSGYRPKGKRKRQLYILQGLPGLGPGRAGKLLDYFGDVKSVINATPDELKSITGIGSTIAEKIKWAIE